MVFLLSGVSAETPRGDLPRASSVTLFTSDFTVKSIANCTVSGNVVTSVANQYPQFKVTLPEVYYIDELVFHITVNGISYKCTENSGVLVAGKRFKGTLSAGKQSDISFVLEGEEQFEEIETVLFNGFWSSKPTAGAASLTIDSIDIKGVPLTGTIELTGDNIKFSSPNNCTVSGNSIISNKSRYPQFYLELGKDYRIRNIAITATAENHNYSTSNYNISLNKDKEKVVSIPWYYSVYSAGVTSSKSYTVSEEYQFSKVNQVALYGMFTSAPSSDVPAKLTINSVHIKYWIMPSDDFTVAGSDLNVTKINNVTVAGNVITASNRSPQFKITLPQSLYADSLDIKIENTYSSNLGWINNSLTLGFDDGTTVVAPVSLGEGEHSYDYWIGAAKAGKTTTVNVAIPSAYLGKKISYISATAYFSSAIGSGSLTVKDVTLKGAITCDYAIYLIEQINNVHSYTNGMAQYSLVNNRYKEAVYPHIVTDTYCPVLISTHVNDDTSHGLEGDPVITVALPGIEKEGLALSEFGIIALPSEYAKDELTIETDGIIRISKKMEVGDDPELFSTYSVPLTIGADYGGEQLTVRAYVIYRNSDGVFYSNNDYDDYGIQSGTVQVTFPAALEIGDANRDGGVDIKDIVRLKRNLSANYGSVTTVGGDANGDGAVDKNDITAFENCLIGSEELPEYPNIEEFSDPDIWTCTIDGRTFNRNMSSRNFKSSDYEDAQFEGGIDVRKGNFERGIGITAWNAEGGWHRSDEMIALDNANLEELNITSKRTWGEGAAGVLDSGYNYATNISVSGILEKQEYADGTPASAYQWNATLAASKVLKNWRTLLSDPLVRLQNKVILVGNEYRLLNKNSTTNKWEICGYDGVTLQSFKNDWCKTRFGTIENLNSALGTNYGSFDEIYSVTSNKRLYYEFWLYQRQSFRNLITRVISGMKSSYPETKWGYAAYRTFDGPFSDNLYLDSLDYTSQNFYFGGLYMQDYHDWSFGMDNLAAWSKTAPVLVTEVGFPNTLDTDTQISVARKYKQFLNLFYMRPRYEGTYIFNYTSSDVPDEEMNSTTWGVVDAYRNRYPCFYTVKQVYGDFKKLDEFYTGASNTPLVAITNHATDYQFYGYTRENTKTASVLYSKGVPVQVVPSDDSARLDTLNETKLIWNDRLLFENPDGSGSMSESLANYLNRGGKVYRNNAVIPSSLYGKSNLFTANSTDELSDNYSGLTVSKTDDTDKYALWRELGKFIHGDFISGKITPTKNKIDENAVRVLDVEAFSSSLQDPTYDIETKMVYKNGYMYLCLVNTSDDVIDSVDVTIGVNNGVKCNLSPYLLCGDSDVSVVKQRRAYIPSFVDETIESKIDYGTVTVKNLDTYAYICLGRAVN